MSLHLPGWGNNELEVYTENNVLVSGGYLSIIASFDGANFLSGRIRTFAKRDFVPSKDTPNGIRVEASIQMPQGTSKQASSLEGKATTARAVICVAWRGLLF